MKVEEIGTLEAKTNLSALLNQVLEGKSFYLTRRAKRIAERRPGAPPAHTRRAGFAKGTFTYILRTSTRHWTTSPTIASDATPRYANMLSFVESL